jgi:hypothetical protein
MYLLGKVKRSQAIQVSDVSVDIVFEHSHHLDVLFTTVEWRGVRPYKSIAFLLVLKKTVSQQHPSHLEVRTHDGLVERTSAFSQRRRQLSTRSIAGHGTGDCLLRLRLSRLERD